MDNYEMDTIKVSGADESLLKNPDADLDVKAGSKSFTAWNEKRDRTPYDTTDTQDPKLAEWVKCTETYVAMRDYVVHVKQNSINNKGYWSEAQHIPDINKEAKEYEAKANELLGEINIESLNKKDYKQLADVMCNKNNEGQNLEDTIERSTKVRNVVKNLTKDQLSSTLNNMSKREQENFLNNAETLYPESMPDKDAIEHDTKKALQNFLDREPRPDFTNLSSVKGYVIQETYNVHEERKQMEAIESSRNAIMNGDKTSRFEATDTKLNAFDINALAHGKLNKEKTGLDFNFD